MKIRRSCVVVALSGLAAGPVSASGIGLFEWTPATGNADWNSLLQIGSDSMGNPIFLSNWDRTGINQNLLFPDGGDTALFNADSLVTGTGGASTIVVAGGRTLTLGNDASIGVEGVSLDNNGTLTFVSDPVNGIPSRPDQQLSFSGGVQTVGGGTISMVDAQSGLLFNAGVSTNTNNLIRGSGVIRLAEDSTFVNEGTIRADLPGGTLFIDRRFQFAPAGRLINNGMIEVVNGSTLSARIVEIDGSGSVFVGGSSTLDVTIPLLSASSITVQAGGILNAGSSTFANATLAVSQTSLINGEYVLRDATIQGTLVARNTLELNNVIGFDGTVTNTGIITFDTTTFGQIGVDLGASSLSGNAAIVGPGQLVLNDEFGARLRVVGSFGVNGASVANLTHGPDHTIRGTGQIGVGGTSFGTPDQILGIFNNQGTIDADTPSQTLLVQGSTGLSRFNNSGTMAASNGGTLRIEFCELDQTGGTFDVDAASRLEMCSVVVTGGTVEFPDAGNFDLEQTTFDGITVTGIVDRFAWGVIKDCTIEGSLFADFLQTNSITQLDGTVENNGLISYVAGIGTIGTRSGPATLTGTGELVMTDDFSSRIQCRGLYSTFNGSLSVVTLTHGPGHTVRGEGLIDLAPTVSGPGSASFDEFLSIFDNEGTIRADVGGAEIAVIGRTNNSLLNNSGTLAASNGGTLRLNSLEVRGDGVVSVEAGSVFDFNAQRLECSAFLGGFDHNTGVFAPQQAPAGARGPSAQSLLDGNYTQSTSFPSFEVTLDSREAGGFTSLLIMGDATLTGSLVVVSDPAFSPLPGDRFQILTIDGALTGEFSNFAEGDPVGTFNGIELSISYVGGDGNDIELVAEDCPADVNGDGVASPADFTAWLACFNNPASAPFCERADVNDSGSIEPADFTAWLAAFNAGC